VIRDAHRVDLRCWGGPFAGRIGSSGRSFRVGEDPFAPGDLTGEIHAFLLAGMNGIFLDHPCAGRSICVHSEPSTSRRDSACVNAAVVA
jgi:glycerophosphoryl diester phosphodiesterase